MAARGLANGPGTTGVTIGEAGSVEEAGQSSLPDGNPSVGVGPEPENGQPEENQHQLTFGIAYGAGSLKAP